MPDINPFTQVYNALWTLVERNPALQQYLLPGNKTKYESDSLPKSAKADADFPELALLNGEMTNLTFNSSSTGITKRYTWQLATGDLRHPLHGEISFELFRSMVDYETTLCALLWKTCTFVNHCRIVSEDIGTLFDEANQGVVGWSSLLTIEVDFMFNTNALRITP